jgi:hypothetical protein
VITKKIYIAVTLASWHWSSCESKLNVQTTQGAATSGCKGKKSAELCEVATNLSWSESSPQRSVNATAKWTISSSADLSSQKIQLYSDSSCTTTLGSAVDLSSVNSSSYLVTVSQYGTTVSFKIQSFTSTGKSGWSACSASMSFEEPLITPEPVTVSVPGGFYTSLQRVALTTKTKDATIYYTLDGTVPTAASTKYSAPVELKGRKVLKAVAIRKNISSIVFSETYQVVLRIKTNSETAFDWPVGSTKVTELSNGNIVVGIGAMDVDGVTDAGAVYLVNGDTGETISVLTGSSSGDQVGVKDVIEVAGGNFIVPVPQWSSGTSSSVGAITLVSGKTGLNGVVSAANSLIGTSSGDGLGSVKILGSGNLLVTAPNWDCVTTLGCASNVTDVGIVKVINPSNFPFGPITASGALVGSTSGDKIGYRASILNNSNAVVYSDFWDCTLGAGCSGTVTDVGAATWVDGSNGISGQVSVSNSLTGSSTGDGSMMSILALSNGNYVLGVPFWDCSIARGCAGSVVNVGAATWGDGAAGTSGFVSASNSLIGSSVGDSIGINGLTGLTNGNYIVNSPNWNCTVAAGCAGPVSFVGAATWRSGIAANPAVVTLSNSLIGRTSSDYVGQISTALKNGNYVIVSTGWDCSVANGCAGAVANVGAVTWGNGASGTSGYVAQSNSIVGSTTGDAVGGGYVTALENGNYVFASPQWDCQATLGCSGAVTAAGAVTWALGSGATSDVVSINNSLIGSTANDGVGTVLALVNSNYVVSSTNWDSLTGTGNVGAVTWGNGTTGTFGAVGPSNSLVGFSINDQVGLGGILALSNGHYVIGSTAWSCSTSRGCKDNMPNVGASTWASGTTASTGFIEASNSIIGSSFGDAIGLYSVDFKNGNYLLRSRMWDCSVQTGCDVQVTNAGALTIVDGTKSISMVLSAANSLVGSTASDLLGYGLTTNGLSNLSGGRLFLSTTYWSSAKTQNAGLAIILDSIPGLGGVIPKD